MTQDLPFTLPALRAAYAAGARPEDVIALAFTRLDAAGDPGVLIHDAREAALAAARGLGPRDDRPLWGVPFVVKDNIDVAGMPTTAACPDFSYVADTDAFVVARLLAAGAICLGKANLDQFATGLVGLRTPYPVPRNAIDPEIVPGGSSSGSAVAVALGVAAFSLGTDTAGSGRVPGALNGIVGLKPSLGALSASGMIPACRTLDTISIFALTTADAWEVLAVSQAEDPADAYSRAFPAPRLSPLPPRLRIGVPTQDTLVTDGDADQAASFHATLTRMRTQGVEVAEIDLTPFYDVARLLYEGAWVAERTAAIGDRLTDKPETLHPVTRQIVSAGLGLTAVDAFRAQYRLAALRKLCLEALQGIDMLCVPTIPRFVTTAEIAVDPIGPNSLLGTYTNFVNLLDMSGLAVPTGLRRDGRRGSVTFLGRAGDDARLAAAAMLVEDGPMGATGWARPPAPTIAAGAGDDELPVFVCGAHMSGMPLNGELAALGARFLRACHTAPAYKLYALAGGPPRRPGLARVAQGGRAIAGELWALPLASAGRFLSGIPAPLGLGTVELEDKSEEVGFICEAYGLDTALDVSEFGSWRAYMAQAVAPVRPAAEIPAP
ncbi:allophanate hydrolase [Salipiger sp. P9]|uniref:allophanate hydrolase n=1 Tax=Salipiger pentaromativorans TaxID=2943193 RepID=UPI002157B343|nr:allophanate hydrolase [Salipiger pentaromativorans]MCR8548662.1 allophanate hydrolase [Salipiger pentaromativorans]